ncbi:MAG TPA: two-component regulator propeller domain-containing protein [bacterium]|nr:two-component regulator propeller domain-containing protein [bacterium]HMZ03540.1 two-component regulator propeller domain-containing protein [bacterium]HNB08083.1 two-component regulator propeller domain-containing protein [bacterium]HNH28861.1 two-component regulator propeller domain-containing protein [bacterium]HNH31708.1 two-component regulator propeller domain-containing protein [bacterium]
MSITSEKIFRLLFCVFLFLFMLAADTKALDPERSVTQYVHDVWLKEDGLPGISVLSFYQTREGYLWIGSFEGLARFDGAKFTLFNRRSIDAFLSYGLWRILEDKHGYIWMGTNGNGIYRFKDPNFQRLAVTNGLTNDNVLSLAMDQDEMVWAGTRKGLNRIRIISQDSFAVEPVMYRSNVLQDVFGLCTDHDGTVWIGATNTIYRYVEGRLEEFANIGERIRSMYVDRDNRIWIGTTNAGVFQISENQLRHFTTKNGLPPESIWRVWYDRDGNVWLGSDGMGLFRAKPGSFRDENELISLEQFSEKEGLTNNRISALFEDREGSLWIGTFRGGLNRLRDGKFITYASANGMVHPVVYPIVQEHNGDMWFGTEGGLSHYSGNRFVNYTTANGLSNNQVRGIVRDSRGRLWVGTYGAGLDIFNPASGRFAPAPSAINHAFRNIRDMLKDREGHLWIGTINSIGLIKPDGSHRTFTMQDGLLTTSILCLYEDIYGNVWAGTDGGGAARYDRNKGFFRVLTMKDGLSSDIVFAIHCDRDSVYWFATQSGITRYDPRATDLPFASLTVRQGLPADAAFEILEDNHGYIWLGGAEGIFRISKKDFEDVARGKTNQLTPLLFGRPDGMKTSQTTPSGRAHKTSDGKLWFPTPKGAVVIDPDKIKTNPVPPPVVIERCIADGQSWPIQNDVVLPPGILRIEFQYAALSFLAPQRVFHKFKLEGFDTDWMDAGTRRTAFYTGLHPGEYTFKVIACNNDGIWASEPTSFSFTIRPHFYETRWFLLLIFGGMIAAALSLYRWRVRHLMHREKELAALVKLRTHNLEEEKKRTEDARIEAERQREEALRANELKTQFLGMASHDLKNPLAAIISYTDLIIEAYDDKAQSMRDLGYIRKAAHRMLHLINGLLNTVSLESGKVVLQKEKLDVSDLAEQVLFSNQQMLERKRQHVQVQTVPGLYVNADRDRLYEALDNLISNAIKYSDYDKTIRVDLGMNELKIIIRITDEGPGMTTDDMKKLFGKFQRLSAKPTGGETSTGLGLSIVKQIVEMHEGQVWAESESGKGSTFVVELPRFTS